MRQLKLQSVQGREISKNYFSQPLKSGEADASPASPVPRPLQIAKDNDNDIILQSGSRLLIHNYLGLNKYKYIIGTSK